MRVRSYSRGQTCNSLTLALASELRQEQITCATNVYVIVITCPCLKCNSVQAYLQPVCLAWLPTRPTAHIYLCACCVYMHKHERNVLPHRLTCVISYRIFYGRPYRPRHIMAYANWVDKKNRFHSAARKSWSRWEKYRRFEIPLMLMRRTTHFFPSPALPSPSNHQCDAM